MIPRRARMDAWTPGERAIYDAVQSVESMGAHPALTHVVVLLQQAREKLADYVDSEKKDPFVSPQEKAWYE